MPGRAGASTASMLLMLAIVQEPAGSLLITNCWLPRPR
jgi:hypothetical protein